MYRQATRFLQRRKYELLLAALIQHLFIGIVLTDMPLYTRVIWPANMVLLGLASVGVFIEKSRWKNWVLNILSIVVVILPISLPFVGYFKEFMAYVSLAYVFFFLFIFREIIQFLVRPSYINVDVISASACGYLLLIETSAFLMQFLLYNHPDWFKGVDMSGPAVIFIDMVYFCSITLTSIGFGDITPSVHQTKLITSLLGIVGQFYLVVVVGILISKFSSIENQ